MTTKTAQQILSKMEDVVFRNGARRIQVEWDERHHSETEGIVDLHRDLYDGKLKNVTACKIPF